MFLLCFPATNSFILYCGHNRSLPYDLYCEPNSEKSVFLKCFLHLLAIILFKPFYSPPMLIAASMVYVLCLGKPCFRQMAIHPLSPILLYCIVHLMHLLFRPLVTCSFSDILCWRQSRVEV